MRAAVIRDGRILLVQERNNGRWTLPGGFAEIGYSAAENAEKEVMEEAGLKVRASALYGVRHKAKGPFAPDVRDFYKLYFLCQRLDDGAPAPGPETADAAYFAPDRLPHLCRDRVAAQDIERAFAFMARPDRVFLD
ncbi:NUDIX domain-containing protein [Achromobacter xylosoxidans]